VTLPFGVDEITKEDERLRKAVAKCSMPAGLPSFAQLAKRVMDSLHAPLDAPSRRLFENGGDLDRVFNLLREEYAPDEVEGTVSRILSRTRAQSDAQSSGGDPLMPADVRELPGNAPESRQVRRALERAEQKVAEKMLEAKRWIRWRPAPDRNDPRKINKVPIDPFTNQPFEEGSGWQTNPSRWAIRARTRSG